MSSNENELNILKKAIEIHKQGNLAAAKEYYSRYLNLVPDNKEVLDIYANLLSTLQDFQSAIEVYLKLLTLLNDNDFNVLYQLSLLYSQINNKETSLEYAIKAFEIKKEDLNVLLHISSLYHDMKKEEKEIFYLEKAAEIYNKDEFIFLKLAIMHKNNENNQKALYYYDKCLNVNPNNFTALSGLAMILIKLEQYDISYQIIERAYNINPNAKEVYNALFLLNIETRNYQDAIDAANSIISISPDYYFGYACLGQVYFEAVDYSLALECFEKALTLKNDDIDCLYNRAFCLERLNRFDECKSAIYHLLDLSPNHLMAINLLCSVDMKRKKFDEIREKYFELMSPSNIAKLKKRKMIPKFSNYYQKHWKNENLENKQLLIYNDAGAGDFIMISRYIKSLENKNIKLILEADKNFVDLYKNSFNNIEIYTETDDCINVEYDYSASTMALLYNVKADFNNIPFKEGWLKADEKLVKEFSKKEIFNNNKKKIGIFWRGNKKILRNRFIDLNDLITIFELKDKYSFYSLDIEEKDTETNSILQKYNVYDCSDLISTFNDTAAILKNVDIVITIDSSICHLAGALGITTYLLLPENSEWRWFFDKKYCSWYDSVTIFKQNKQSEWKSVIAELKQQL